MSFSVKLADLDDFIGPSQSCVKPLIDTKQTSPQPSTVTIQYDEPNTNNKTFSQIKASQHKTAQITLNDCLACSGCVTSAETMLVEQQSLDALLNTIHSDTDKTLIVASVAMQSVTSISARLDIDIYTAWNRIQAKLHSIGVHHVIDATFAWDIALLEAAQEFVQRYNQGRETLPVLCGECPGWVCYAEKMQHEVLKLISNVRSPQQILGVLIKHYMSTKLGLEEKNIFHFAVAPCFDKKLEASRQRDFGKDVDLVIATTELLQLLEQDSEEKNVQSGENVFLRSEQKSHSGNEESFLFFSNFKGNQIHRGSIFDAGSGGYAEYIFRYASKKLFGVDFPPEERLNFVANKKNPDLQEIELIVDGQVKLRFAKAYGFRNIQNLVRKLKNPKLSTKKYDYVEVMACPSGCLNGGGQLRAEVTNASGKGVRFSVKSQKELTDKLELMFESTDFVTHRDPSENPVVSEIYRSWLCCSVGDANAREKFHTGFHAVVPLEEMLTADKESSGLAIKW